MTIEYSLRRRAIHARRLAAVWMGIAVIILISTYASLPFIINKALIIIRTVEGQDPIDNGAADIHMQYFILSIATIELMAVAFACYLLGRSAIIEIELSVRFNGLADALCLSGNNWEQFEKATLLMVPKTKHLTSKDFSPKDYKWLIDILKSAR